MRSGRDDGALLPFLELEGGVGFMENLFRSDCSLQSVSFALRSGL